MALQPYVPPGTGSSGAIVSYTGQQISAEEREKRIKDAEELEKKLTHIQESIPVRVVQIMGSNAGAGSGEFHMYRQARRREQMRLERIDEQDRKEKAASEFQAKQQELQQLEEQRTAKRRAKRQKKKQRKKARSAPDGTPAGNGVAEADSDSESGGDAGQHAALD